MRVLHVIPSLSVKEGGPSFAVKALAEALAGQGVQVTVATTTAAQSAPVIGDQLSVIGEETREEDASSTEREGAAGSDRGYRVISFRREFEPYKISFGLARWLRENVRKFDLVHIHALFSFSSTMAARIARKNGVPYVVRPLGVLNQWGMQNRRRLPKLVSLRLIELPILFNSAAIHFTSESEREEAALLDGRLSEHKSAVIPLPVALGDLSEVRGQRSEARRMGAGEPKVFHARYPWLDSRRIILFLSRIDRKKGIELLLDAFAVVRGKDRDVALVIAGDGEKAYERLDFADSNKARRGPLCLSQRLRDNPGAWRMGGWLLLEQCHSPLATARPYCHLRSAPSNVPNSRHCRFEACTRTNEWSSGSSGARLCRRCDRSGGRDTSKVAGVCRGARARRG